MIREGTLQKSPLVDLYQLTCLIKELLSVTVREETRGKAVLSKGGTAKRMASAVEQVIQTELLL